MRGLGLLGYPSEGSRSTPWRVFRVYPFGVLTLEDDDLLEYILETFDYNFDLASVKPVLTKAKVALGISDVSSHRSKKKKNTESRATYSMSVAEQLVTTAEKLLRDDQSQSIGSAE